MDRRRDDGIAFFSFRTTEGGGEGDVHLITSLPCPPPPPPVTPHKGMTLALLLLFLSFFLLCPGGGGGVPLCSPPPSLRGSPGAPCGLYFPPPNKNKKKGMSISYSPQRPMRWLCVCVCVCGTPFLENLFGFAQPGAPHSFLHFWRLTPLSLSLFGTREYRFQIHTPYFPFLPVFQISMKFGREGGHWRRQTHMPFVPLSSLLPPLPPC